MLTNPRDTYTSVNITKHGTIRYVKYGFLLVFYTVSLTLTVFETFDYTVNLKPGLGVTQGHRNRH